MASRAGILSILTILALACGAAQAQDGVGSGLIGGNPTGGPSYSAVYSTLFEPGRTFTYHVHSRSTLYDPENAEANEDGYLVDESEGDTTCTTDVQYLSSAMVSTLSCDADDQGVVGAIYLATPDGLWQVWDAPASDADVAAALAIGVAMLSSPMAPGIQTQNHEDGGTEHEVTSDPTNGWCSRYSVWGGDETTTTRCLSEGRGITYATWAWAGGSDRQQEFTLIPNP